MCSLYQSLLLLQLPPLPEEAEGPMLGDEEQEGARPVTEEMEEIQQPEEFEEEDFENELEETEEEAEARRARTEAARQEEFTWHENTVQIMTFLRKRMKGKSSYKFSQLTSRASRPTAASCFWELLQLKTMDFIEIKQVGPTVQTNVHRKESTIS